MFPRLKHKTFSYSGQSFVVFPWVVRRRSEGRRQQLEKCCIILLLAYLAGAEIFSTCMCVSLTLIS